MMKIKEPLRGECTYIDNLKRIIKPMYIFGSVMECAVFLNEDDTVPYDRRVFDIDTGCDIHNKFIYIVSLKDNYLNSIIYDED